MSVPKSLSTRRARPPGSGASMNSRCSVPTSGRGESRPAVAAWWAAASTAQVASADMAGTASPGWPGGPNSRCAESRITSVVTPRRSRGRGGDTFGEQAGEQVVGADLGRAVGLRYHAGPVQAGLQPAVGFGGAGRFGGHGDGGVEAGQRVWDSNAQPALPPWHLREARAVMVSEDEHVQRMRPSLLNVFRLTNHTHGRALALDRAWWFVPLP